MKFTKAITNTLGMLLFVSASFTFAQSTGLARALVTQGDVSIPNREAIIDNVKVIPAGTSGWHTHPGEESTYVSDGNLVLLVAGQPERKLAAGEGFVISAGVVHNIRNEGSKSVNLISVYVVEKGKPLASPAPAPKN
ncbi:cupin domain-containing protein [Polynucleobacter sp. CS-Odin-A6]|uniref:cupin domain-containing protein n=1 Tax=Polynucleobacter sp. CS-Odin-A6 TaxID=2689106 RepID=UPI001C0B1F5F|nr:cupin domain-containing protein [Polynucleobacter sp. CS-Odin-A6]MBU3621999.1 cupin domain-containing protein [Polynucleobacter sp. CS-Odin-A6]